ncbi:MAG: SPOR domain-containing protein [Desulfuromonadaceae bacterium]|nr:SPOR domain-containing protein [Desulfuromonadaceae bacterium]
MRIDYSEPKKSSCGSPQTSQNRPRKKSSGGILIVVVITGILCLVIGFGSGWMLSQRAAKNGFKAAMEQQSLENSPQQINSQTSQQQPVPPSPAQTPSPPATGGTQATANPPLSFYKTLPSGQKNNVLGSGINSMDSKPAKQPLQAAIPANLSRSAPAQKDEDVQKQPAQVIQARTASRQDSNGLTVQVASYSLKSEAEVQRSKLAAKGYNATIAESHLGDKGTWYRVRIGKRLDPDAAKELAAKLGKGAIAVPDKD